MRAIGILAALLAILLWTFANTIVELETHLLQFDRVHMR